MYVIKLMIGPNIVLSLAAAIVADSLGAETVSLAAHAGDHAIYPDCRSETLALLDGVLMHGHYDGMVLEYPFATARKEDVVSLGRELGVPMELTWSCYEGRENHCGKCGTCVERKEAFVIAGVSDPTKYEEEA